MVMTDLTEKMVKTALMVRRDKMKVMGTIEKQVNGKIYDIYRCFLFCKPNPLRAESNVVAHERDG